MPPTKKKTKTKLKTKAKAKTTPKKKVKAKAKAKKSTIKTKPEKFIEYMRENNSMVDYLMSLPVLSSPKKRSRGK